MPRGDKSKYTDKQKRQAQHIEEGYEKQGLSEKTAEKRAWATVNKVTGGGKKPGGSGVGKQPAGAKRMPALKAAATRAAVKGKVRRVKAKAKRKVARVKRKVKRK